ncbi:MAG: recombination-associated protein RdgC [Gammaproteobacteria bacterium]|nr:recombination-associated protein RdgC [Gammaproteobacteria bacterium]
MWFKNLRLYRLTGPFTLSAQALDQQLASRAFAPCARTATFSYGWESPFGSTNPLQVHAVNGCLLICARRDEKIMPAGVLRHMVRNKVAALEQSQQRKVHKREREAIRDEVIQDVLPRALLRSSLTHAYLWPSQGWLIIDTASTKAAEALIGLLRATLGSFVVEPLSVQHTPAAVMTQWLMQRAMPAGLVAEDECVLQDPFQDGGTVRCRGLDLAGAEVRAHLEAGKLVTRLALCWNESLSLVLEQDLAIKRLHFADLLRSRSEDIGHEDAAAQLDADFAIMTLELSRVLTALVQMFGGVASASQPAVQAA